MEEYTGSKCYENGGLPVRAVFERSRNYGKNYKLINEADPLAAYSGLPEPTIPAAEEMDRLVVPSAVWTAGILYYTYFVGEEMRLFDVADVLVTRWAQGKLDVVEERTIIALDRLMKKRERRISPEERTLLYKRVFNFGTIKPEAYMMVNEAFPSDWNRLMKGVAAYPNDPARESGEPAFAARNTIIQATYDLQFHLSQALAGTAYMMAAEVFTLLREASELLHSEEVIRIFGDPGVGVNSVIERIAAEEFNVMLPVNLLTRMAESGSHILQDWVAKFSPQTSEDSMLHTLLVPAQDWRLVNSQLSGQ